MRTFVILPDNRDEPSQSIVFTIQELATPIGEVSQFSTVYPAQRSDEESQEGKPGWIVKTSSTRAYNQRFEEEYKLLVRLAETASEAGRKPHIPDPVYLVQEVNTEIFSIAMPLYHKSVRQVYASSPPAEEDRILLPLIQYIEMLDSLPPNVTTLDRKPDDLFWIEDEAHLVVIDWNVVSESTPSNATSVMYEQMRKFVRLVIQIFLGRDLLRGQMLDPFQDDSWIPFNQQDPRFSLGFRIILENTWKETYSSYGDLMKVLRWWQQHWQTAIDLNQIQQQIHGLASSEKAAAIIRVDREWIQNQSSDEVKAHRQNLLDELREFDPGLWMWLDPLRQIASFFGQSDFKNVAEELERLQPETGVQEAAIQRWRVALDTRQRPAWGIEYFRRSRPSISDTEFRAEFRNELVAVVQLLQRPLRDDGSSDQPEGSDTRPASVFEQHQKRLSDLLKFVDDTVKKLQPRQDESSTIPTELESLQGIGEAIQPLLEELTVRIAYLRITHHQPTHDEDFPKIDWDEIKIKEIWEKHAYLSSFFPQTAYQALLEAAEESRLRQQHLEYLETRLQTLKARAREDLTKRDETFHNFQRELQQQIDQGYREGWGPVTETTYFDYIAILTQLVGDLSDIAYRDSNWVIAQRANLVDRAADILDSRQATEQYLIHQMHTRIGRILNVLQDKYFKPFYEAKTELEILAFPVEWIDREIENILQLHEQDGTFVPDNLYAEAQALNEQNQIIATLQKRMKDPIDLSHLHYAKEHELSRIPYFKELNGKSYLTARGEYASEVKKRLDTIEKSLEDLSTNTNRRSEPLDTATEDVSPHAESIATVEKRLDILQQEIAQVREADAGMQKKLEDLLEEVNNLPDAFEEIISPVKTATTATSDEPPAKRNYLFLGLMIFGIMLAGIALWGILNQMNPPGNALPATVVLPATSTATATMTATAMPTNTAVPSVTNTSTQTPSATPSPTNTPTPSATPEPTATPTPTSLDSTDTDDAQDDVRLNVGAQSCQPIVFNFPIPQDTTSCIPADDGAAAIISQPGTPQVQRYNPELGRGDSVLHERVAISFSAQQDEEGATQYVLLHRPTEDAAASFLPYAIIDADAEEASHTIRIGGNSIEVPRESVVRFHYRLIEDNSALQVVLSIQNSEGQTASVFAGRGDENLDPSAVTEENGWSALTPLSLNENVSSG